MSENTPPKPDPLAAYFAPAGQILLVDGDIRTADELSDILEGAGYMVEVATSYDQALIVGAGFLADLVIVDTELTDRTSSDITHALRASPDTKSHYAHAKFLYLVERDLLINQRFRLHPDAPMTSLVMKPIDAHSFLDRVRRALEAGPKAS